MTRSRPVVVLVVLAAGLAVAAAAVLWVRTRPVDRTTTVVTQSPQPPTVIADCPLTRCKTISARPQVLSAVRTVFPAAVLLSGVRVVGSDGRVYSEVSIFTAGLQSISVKARCVNGIGSIPDRTQSASPEELVSVVVGGRSGCSVAVAVSQNSGSVDVAVVTRLARLPDLQIPA